MLAHRKAAKGKVSSLTPIIHKQEEKSMGVKIDALEIENVKRIKALSLVPAADGLTVIGGNNGQGKTSVLDTICWALGGDRYRPSNPQREDSVLPPRIKLTLSNGLIVERTGKNSALKVTDPTGRKSGQQLLNEFVEELAINLPKFLASSSKEKADTLLRIIGVEKELAQLELQEQQLYNRRHDIGLTRDRLQNYAETLPFYPDAPKEPISISELIARQQAILAKNGRNQELRNRRDQLEQQVSALQATIQNQMQQLENLTADLETARRDAQDLQDESTQDLERDISDYEAINKQVNANLDRSKAEDDAQIYSKQYESLTTEIEKTRNAKIDLLKSAKLPLPDLFVEGGELLYKGKKWDCMSSADQLRVATAIVKAINPKCGFVLLDKLEQMDLNTLNEFGTWLQSEGLQGIATRVSTGDECSILIEDGEAVQPEVPQHKKWKAGEF